MKKRILFVDDDPQLLKSLNRMLWAAQDRWELTFRTSGTEALEEFERQPFDVLVADMRMPGMEGHQLLAHVRKRYPWALRIVLSGISDRGLIMRSVPVSHQFLTKPVTAEQLIGVIERGCRLRDAILSDELKNLIGAIDALPAQPEVYAKLVRILEDEAAPVETVAGIISQDMALTADVLKLVNSSFFGPRMHVSRLEQAVTLLGLDTIKSLVLCVQLLKVFDIRKFPDFSFPGLWEHSRKAALFARAIAAEEGLSPAAQDDCFIAGMLHDLGKFVLADKLFPRYREAVALARSENIPIIEAESATLGATHPQAGAYLLGLWGLSDRILEAVAFHHEPQATQLPGVSAATVVHAANALEHELVVINADYAPRPLHAGHLESLGLEDRAGRWRQVCLDTLTQGEKK